MENTNCGILINIDQPAVRKVHVGYVVSKKESKLLLSEVAEVFYPHPQAPDNAVISRIEIIPLGEYDEDCRFYSALNLFYYASKNLEVRCFL